MKSGNRKMLRSDAQAIIKAKGGKVITGEYGKLRNANLLVLGEQATGRISSQKMDESARRHVTTITAEEFFRMIS